MEYWNDGIVGRIFALFFVILHSAFCTPQSKRGVILCYGSWMAPKGGPFRVQSLKFKVESKSNSLDFREGKHGQDH